MSAREKWSVPRTCKKCGATGNATFSEDTGVIMTSETLQMENVSGDFRLVTMGRTADETKFVCLKCGTETP